MARERVDNSQVLESHISQAEEFRMHHMANRKPPRVLSRVKLSSLLRFTKILLIQVGRVAWRLSQGRGIY